MRKKTSILHEECEHIVFTYHYATILSSLIDTHDYCYVYKRINAIIYRNRNCQVVVPISKKHGWGGEGTEVRIWIRNGGENV